MIWKFSKNVKISKISKKMSRFQFLNMKDLRTFSFSYEQICDCIDHWILCSVEPVFGGLQLGHKRRPGGKSNTRTAQKSVSKRQKIETDQSSTEPHRHGLSQSILMVLNLYLSC